MHAIKNYWQHLLDGILVAFMVDLDNNWWILDASETDCIYWRSAKDYMGKGPILQEESVCEHQIMPG